MNKIVLRGLIETLTQIETDINSLSEIGIDKTDDIKDELIAAIELLKRELE